LTAEGREWLPGVELFGEGVYIDLAPHTPGGPDPWHFPMSGAENDGWYRAWHDPESFGFPVGQDDGEQLHPVFVWWHTFAHRLMTALSVDSGYSAAAIRERVFVQEAPGAK